MIKKPNLYLLALLAVSFCYIGYLVLIYKNQSLNSALQTKIAENQLIQAENVNLAEQLKNSQKQIDDYRRQVNELNHKILTKITQAETRTNEIATELERYKTWSDAVVPTTVGSLLNNRKSTLSQLKTNTDNLPEESRLSSPVTQY